MCRAFNATNKHRNEILCPLTVTAKAAICCVHSNDCSDSLQYQENKQTNTQTNSLRPLTGAASAAVCLVYTGHRPKQTKSSYPMNIAALAAVCCGHGDDCKEQTNKQTYNK